MEIGIAARTALPLVHAQRERHAGAIDLPSPHAVRAADFEPECGRRSGHCRFGVVQQSQRVHNRRVAGRVYRECADRIGPARRDVGSGEVVALVQPIRQRKPRSGGIDVVVFALLQDFPLERALALDAAIDRPEAGRTGDRTYAADVLVPGRAGRHGAAAIDAQRTDREGIGPRDLVELQNVEGGISRDSRRIDDEEEPAGFIVEIARFAVERLAGDVADAVEAVFDDVALLLRQDAAQLERADLRDCLDAEIVRRNLRRDEPRRRRLERHVARFDAAQHLVFKSLVPDVEIVVGVELALAVEVHVDVQPLADDAGAANRVLRVRRYCRESRIAPGQRELDLLRRASQVAELIRLELQPQVELHAELGVRGGGEGRRRGGGGRQQRCRDGSRRTKKRWSLREHAFRPRLRDEGRGDPRAEAAAGRQCGMAWRSEWRHAKRVHRSLRMNPGYDEREGESN